MYASYADSAVLLVKHKNFNDFINIANKCLSSVKDWWVNNNVQLNLDKFKYVIFNISNILF